MRTYGLRGAIAEAQEADPRSRGIFATRVCGREAIRRDDNSRDRALK